MTTQASIDWPQVIWRPVVDGTRVSPGCAGRCGATAQGRFAGVAANRDSRDGRRGHRPYAIGVGHGWDNGTRLVTEALEEPGRWKGPRFVHVSSESDLFYEAIPSPFIQRVFDVMARCPYHIFQVLTKRSTRLAALARHLPWPANVWMGVSVEDRDDTFRIEQLRNTCAAVKFLSLEPLLGPLPNLNLRGIDWVIVGGDQGPGAKRVQREWVVDIRDQCQKAEIPFFFKRWGGRSKNGTARDLDGRTWDEMPRACTPACDPAHSGVAVAAGASGVDESRLLSEQHAV
jgi:protein gp37